MIPRHDSIGKVNFTFLLDGILIYAYFLLGYFFRFHSGLFPEGPVAPFAPYLKVTLFLTCGWLVILHTLGLYRERLHVNLCEELALLTEGSAWAVVLVLAGMFFYRGFAYSRLAVGYGSLFAFVALVVLHVLRIRVRRPRPMRILLLGKGEALDTFLKRMRMHTAMGSVRSLPSESLEDVARAIAEQRPDFIIADVEEAGKGLGLQKIAQESGVRLYFVPRVERFFFSGRVENVDGLPILVSGQLPLERFPAALVKKAGDLTLGSVFFCLFCLALPWIALAIRMESRGPVFFTQKRLGRNGRPFGMFKFRTMKYPFPPGSPYTLPDDPRITRVGRFLRRYNLDELPQILNVLNGDMSLVGPRPVSLEDRMFFALPDFTLRQRAKPGITGWAQIHGLRGGNDEPEERIRYDLYYVENFTPWLDFAILLCSLFSFKNAY